MKCKIKTCILIGVNARSTVNMTRSHNTQQAVNCNQKFFYFLNPLCIAEVSRAHVTEVQPLSSRAEHFRLYYIAGCFFSCFLFLIVSFQKTTAVFNLANFDVQKIETNIQIIGAIWRESHINLRQVTMKRANNEAEKDDEGATDVQIATELVCGADERT